MDFALSPKVVELREQLEAFMDSHIYPAEPVYRAQVAADRWSEPPVMDELKAQARTRGLWNLFLPDDEHGAGLTNLEYAHLAEVMGRSLFLAPTATNCAAPDTGNMEILHMFGTAEQKATWLEPLLAAQ